MAIYLQRLSSDAVVVAVAIHNFGVPSGLKAWMDLVAMPGVAFEYGEDGR